MGKSTINGHIPCHHRQLVTWGAKVSMVLWWMGGVPQPVQSEHGSHHDWSKVQKMYLHYVLMLHVAWIYTHIWYIYTYIYIYAQTVHLWDYWYPLLNPWESCWFHPYNWVNPNDSDWQDLGATSIPAAGQTLKMLIAWTVVWIHSSHVSAHPFPLTAIVPWRLESCSSLWTHALWGRVFMQ